MNPCSSRLRECESHFHSVLVNNSLTYVHRMSVLAVYSLVVAHPGPVFGRSDVNIYESNLTVASDNFAEKAEPGVSTTQHNL